MPKIKKAKHDKLAAKMKKHGKPLDAAKTINMTEKEFATHCESVIKSGGV